MDPLVQYCVPLAAVVALLSAAPAAADDDVISTDCVETSSRRQGSNNYLILSNRCRFEVTTQYCLQNNNTSYDCKNGFNFGTRLLPGESKSINVGSQGWRGVNYFACRYESNGTTYAVASAGPSRAQCLPSGKRR